MFLGHLQLATERLDSGLRSLASRVMFGARQKANAAVRAQVSPFRSMSERRFSSLQLLLPNTDPKQPVQVGCPVIRPARDSGSRLGELFTREAPHIPSLVLLFDPQGHLVEIQHWRGCGLQRFSAT